MLLTLDCVKNPAQSRTEPLQTSQESNPKLWTASNNSTTMAAPENSVTLKIQDISYNGQHSLLSKQDVGSSYIQKFAPAIGSWLLY